MKNRIKKLTANFDRDTRFDRATRFELKPAVATFRVTQETELERLKNGLLQELLGKADQADLNAPLRRAANEAAALAWTTQFPLLFFPTLLEEKARLAVRQTRKQREIYVRTQRLFAEAA